MRGSFRPESVLPATAAATAAAATATALLLLGLVDAQGSTLQVATVELADGLVRIGFVHLDESEATRPSGVTIGDDGSGMYGAKGREMVAQIGLRSAPR